MSVFSGRIFCCNCQILFFIDFLVWIELRFYFSFWLSYYYGGKSNLHPPKVTSCTLLTISFSNPEGLSGESIRLSLLLITLCRDSLPIPRSLCLKNATSFDFNFKLSASVARVDTLSHSSSWGSKDVFDGLCPWTPAFEFWSMYKIMYNTEREERNKISAI